MTANKHPAPTPAQASVHPGAPAARQEEAAPRVGRRLLADLSELFTRRAQQRSGLYLPLVRVDRGD